MCGALELQCFGRFALLFPSRPTGGFVVFWCFAAPAGLADPSRAVERGNSKHSRLAGMVQENELVWVAIFAYECDLTPSCEGAMITLPLSPDGRFMHSRSVNGHRMHQRPPRLLR